MSKTVSRAKERAVQRNVKVRLAMLDIGVAELAALVGISRQSLQHRWRTPVREVDVDYLCGLLGVPRSVLTDSDPTAIGAIRVDDDWKVAVKQWRKERSVEETVQVHVQ